MGAEAFADDEPHEEDFEDEDVTEAMTPAPLPPAPALAPQAPAGLPPEPIVEVSRVRWEAHMSPHGVPYYHNMVTGESRWVLPTGPLDFIVPAGASRPATLPEKDGVLEGSGVSAPRGGIDVSVPGVAGNSSLSSASSSSSVGSSDEGEGDPAAKHPARWANQRLSGFRAMLQEKGVGCFDRYESWLPRLLGDPRFAAVPALDRKALFQKEVKLLGHRQREHAAQTRFAACRGFAELLALARERGTFRDASTPTQALAILAKTDLAKDKRWREALARDRARLVAEVLKEDASERTESRAKAVQSFRALVQEKVLGPSAASNLEPPPFGEARKRLREDARWQAVDDPAERQRLYTLAADEARRAWQQKRRRQAEDEDDIMEKRLRNRRSEAQSEFQGIVRDNIKVLLDLEWPEARVALKLVAGKRADSDLDEAFRELMFNEVKRDELQRRVGVFMETLQRSEAIGVELSFDEARAAAVAHLPSGEAFLRGLPPADLRRGWEDWRRAHLMSAAADFEAWLRSSELIGEAAGDADAIKGQGPEFEALCSRLKTDERYRRLDVVPGERRKLLLDKLREVAASRAAGRVALAASDADAEGDD